MDSNVPPFSIGRIPTVDLSGTAHFLEDVLDGLRQKPKRLASKYFYDHRGSQLFDAICGLDEYYLTRAESEIMETYADEMAIQIGRRVMLVEYGSGSSVKTRQLLDVLIDPACYVPVDISEDHLLQTAEELARAYPDIEIAPVCADFSQPFDLPPVAAAYSHIAVYFPGSTIGNFTASAARRILRQIAGQVGPGGGLLIGIDLHKSNETIERAYNDAAGITAAFNKNLLVRINRELDADFDIDQFDYRARYNIEQQRVESFLISNSRQSVTVAGEQFIFDAGEPILTEYSHKYTIDGFANLASPAGWAIHKVWTDRQRLFAVVHMVVESDPPLQASEPDR
ncbi:MAG: dimethylhistidine N-methyltransferase [Pirellulaceae bacterium]|nr:MAG: dimethylhistidine N-methyltransferase [Pirellulaceae bacterium]